MNCPSCHYNNPDEITKCLICGAEMVEKAEAPVIEPPKKSPVQPTAPVQKPGETPPKQPASAPPPAPVKKGKQPAETDILDQFNEPIDQEKYQMYMEGEGYESNLYLILGAITLGVGFLFYSIYTYFPMKSAGLNNLFFYLFWILLIIGSIIIVYSIIKNFILSKPT